MSSFWKVMVEFEAETGTPYKPTLLVSTYSPLKAIKKAIRYFRRKDKIYRGKVIEIYVSNIVADITI